MALYLYYFVKVFKWYQSTEYYVVLQESKGIIHITFIAVSRSLRRQDPLVNTNKQKNKHMVTCHMIFVHNSISVLQTVSESLFL